jgi:hypothetical protein
MGSDLLLQISSHTLSYVWHGEPSDSGFVRMAEEHTPTLKEPDTYTFKAVDKLSNKMMGVSQWQVFGRPPSEDELSAMLFTRHELRFRKTSLRRKGNS